MDFATMYKQMNDDERKAYAAAGNAAERSKVIAGVAARVSGGGSGTPMHAAAPVAPVVATPAAAPALAAASPMTFAGCEAIYAARKGGAASARPALAAAALTPEYAASVYGSRRVDAGGAQ